MAEVIDWFVEAFSEIHDSGVLGPYQAKLREKRAAKSQG